MPCSHIDPEFPGVAGGGFRAPILHGLCTMGHTIRHVFKEYCGNDSSKFKGCAVRFSSPVIPGETVTPTPPRNLYHTRQPTVSLSKGELITIISRAIIFSPPVVLANGESVV